MSLGNKLTCYLLLGALAVRGFELYLNLEHTRTNLLNDLRGEVAAISRTLQLSLDTAGGDAPERYFDRLAAGISRFENVLGVAFYDREGQVVSLSDSLQGRALPQVDVRRVIATRTPVEGVFKVGRARRYYRVGPIANSDGEGIAAFLIIEDLPLFTNEFRSRTLQILLSTLILFAVLAVIVLVVIRRSVTVPLQTFASQIEAIGQGRFDQRLHSARRDEIGHLAQEFDRMCAQLEAARQRLMIENDEKLRLERAALHHSGKLAALGQLASRLAHEIGTPLNVIQGRAEQLLQRGDLTEKDQAFMSVIVAQIERISGVLYQLRTLTRRPEPQLRIVSLNDIVRRVWEVVGDQGNAAGVEVLLELTEDLPPIWGDLDQLQQVLLNLSVNALQAVGPVGRVTLSSRYSENGSLGATGVVEAVVADTGPGIPQGSLPHIFEPFFTTKGPTGGSGLGLAISHEIVLNHHGEIRVETDPGQGTRFIVSLPRASDAAEQKTDSVPGQKEDRYGNGRA